MELTISGTGYRQIKAEVELRGLVARATEIVAATDWIALRRGFGVLIRNITESVQRRYENALHDTTLRTITW